ncbi:MAG: IMP dehydrogenase [Candidatus Woesearchaeota archaeon]
MKILDGLSYDDVLVVPKYSEIKSRKDVSTKTKLTRNLSINIPIISANMDSVTEKEMAIAMAENGGFGIIHRFMPIEKQVEQISYVKRAESFVIDKPYTLRTSHLLKDAKSLMLKYGSAGIVILDENKKVAGILTKRDILFEKNIDKKIIDLMTPFNDLICGKEGMSMEEATELLKKNKIEKLPLIDDDKNLKGLITSKDILKRESHPLASKDKKGRFLVGGAIGVVGDYLERTEALLNAGCDAICIDIAHGHSLNCVNAIKSIRKNFRDVELIAGNIATKQAAKDLLKYDVDALKVGVGPGSICITRIITGSGFPQLSAIMDVAKTSDVPIIADGGIKNSGDIVKAIAAGADSVMIGNLLAGTEESPGSSIIRQGRKFKLYRGSTSFLGTIDRKERENGNINDEDVYSIVPEGVEGMVSHKGNLKEVLYQLFMGLKSGMSYCGAKSIDEIKNNVDFVKISSSGMRESGSHDIS